MDHDLGRSVADDELQFGHCQPGVERHEDRADAEAGELHLQRIGRVQRQHRDAIALADAADVAEMTGEEPDAGIELRIGEASVAAEIDHRGLGRRAPGMMRNPVVIPYRHGVPSWYQAI